MKKHDYLDLKLGDIEQYSMVIKKADLAHWKKLGWLEYTEIGLPEGTEEAFMNYGEFKKASETLIFNRPVTLRDFGVQNLIGRKILEFSSHLGTYGMGGPGFFGLLIDNSEYFTYAVWGAGQYILLDDRVVECNPSLYHKIRPWVSNFGEEQTWDELTKEIQNSVIKDVELKDDFFKLTLKKGEQTLKMEFAKTRIGVKQNAYEKGKIEDYLIFQHEDAILNVY